MKNSCSFVSIRVASQTKISMNISVYFHDISRQYFLERLSLIFMCRESEGGDDDDSCLLDCTLKASPWRTTFKIFVSIINLLFVNMLLCL